MLRWFLNEVIAQSPFYQESRYKSLSATKKTEQNISQYPLLDKGRLRRMTANFISKRWKPLYFTARSSGSSGVRLKMWFDVEYYISYFAWFRYFLKINKLQPSPLTVNMISITALKNVPVYSVLQPSINFSIFHRVNIHPSHWESPADVVRYISSEAPMVLNGMPTTLELLASYIRDYPPPQSIHPKLILSKSETLLPPVRKKLEDIFNAPVFDTYGLSEVGGFVGYECSEHSGFHINSVDYYIEIVDPSGTPVSEGTEGEIVITNLYHKPVPILRYRTGDFGVITSSPCSCGSVSPRISKLIGRELNMFLTPGGDSYNPYDVYGKYLLKLPVSRFQMVQQDDNKATIYYIGDHDLSNHAMVRAIKREFERIHKGQSFLQFNKVDSFKKKGKFHVFKRCFPIPER